MSNKLNIRPFEKELDFENALCALLPDHGWSDKILVHPTEQELIDNWAGIIFDMNRERERLGDYPLTPSEMQQIIDGVNMCGSPYKVNKFINGKIVCIKRDNPDDTVNFGKEVYLNEDMIEYPEIWAKIHAKLADHGFILRYLEGKEAITGYGYEPWHIRYVGSADVAKEITNNGLTLEEYLNILPVGNVAPPEE